MSKKKCGVLLALILTVLASAQISNAHLDSLKKVIENSESDSLKIKALLKLSDGLMYIDYEAAEVYANQALGLSVKSNSSLDQSQCYAQKATLADSRGDYLKALEYNNQSLKIDLIKNDSLMIQTDYNNIGQTYIILGNLEEAYYYISKSLDLAKKNSQTQDEKKKNEALLTEAISTHNFAVLYSLAGRIDRALTFFQDSEDLSKACHDDLGPAYNNHELGNAYLRVGDFPKAKTNLYFSLAESKRLAQPVLTAQIYQSIGKLSFQTKQYKSAQLYYDSAIAGFKKMGNNFGQADAYMDKSKVFIAQNNLPEAKALVFSSLLTAKELKAQMLMFNCYNVLSQMAEKEGDFKNALMYNKQAHLTRDSLSNANVMSQVFENEFQMRSQKKDDEIANLTKMHQRSTSDLKQQQFIRNIFAVVFTLTMVLLFSVYRSGKRKVELNNQLVQHQAELEKRSKELEELNKVKDKFFSIISHDLRSPINSLAGLLELMEANEIKPEELPVLTREMRNQFNNTKTLISNLLDWTLVQMNKVSIKKERIELKPLINDNIQLLSSMSVKKTTFINDVEEGVTAFADQNMINLVFRNLILNGIKFTDNGGIIKISATKSKNEITVSIADNGVGISPEVQQVLFQKALGYSTRGTANEKGTGLGLMLAKEFIERNGGKIRLESEIKKGTTFFVTIPVA